MATKTATRTNFSIHGTTIPGQFKEISQTTQLASYAFFNRCPNFNRLVCR